MDQVEIRPATEEDIPAIAEIEEKVWISTYPNENEGITRDDVAARFSPEFKTKRAEEIRRDIVNGSPIFKVLVKDEKVIGYSRLVKGEVYNDFIELYILDEFQGQGYGGLMFRDGLAWLGKEKPIQLEAVTYNTRARKIYEHFGFKINTDLKRGEGENWNVLPSGKRIPVVFMVLE